MPFSFFDFFKRTSSKKPPKTTLSYNTDGTINWDDETTKNTLFSKGDESQALENYVFLYDVHRLRKNIFTQDENFNTLATLLYYKHIAKDKERKSYYVLVNNQQKQLNIGINIPDILAQKFHQLIPIIETTDSKIIMDLFEEAVIDVLSMLPSLQRKRQISQTRLKDNALFVTSNNALTSTKDAINWSDNKTKNALFVKGVNEDILGYYVFLYDCYNLRVQFEKNQQEPNNYALAIKLYYKHLVNNPMEYWVVVKNKREYLKNNIRLSNELMSEFEIMIINTNNFSLKQIIGLYDKAVIEVISLLKTPNRIKGLSDSTYSISSGL